MANGRQKCTVLLQVKISLAEQKEKRRWRDNGGGGGQGVVPRERKHDDTSWGNVKQERSVLCKLDHLGTLRGELEGERGFSKALR